MNFIKALFLGLGLSLAASFPVIAGEEVIVEKLAVKDFKKPQDLADFVNNNNITIVKIESFANRRFKFERLWFEPLKLKGGAIASDIADFIDK